MSFSAKFSTSLQYSETIPLRTPIAKTGKTGTLQHREKMVMSSTNINCLKMPLGNGSTTRGSTSRRSGETALFSAASDGLDGIYNSESSFGIESNAVTRRHQRLLTKNAIDHQSSQYH